MDNLPEHDKLRAVSDKSQAIGQFIEWLQDRGIVLARYHEHEESCYDEGEIRVCGTRAGDLVPDYSTIETRLAAYFKIDLKKLEAEKRALLDEVRKLNER